MIYTTDSFITVGRFTIGKDYDCTHLTLMDGTLVGYKVIDDFGEVICTPTHCFSEEQV